MGKQVVQPGPGAQHRGAGRLRSRLWQRELRESRANPTFTLPPRWDCRSHRYVRCRRVQSTWPTVSCSPPRNVLKRQIPEPLSRQLCSRCPAILKVPTLKTGPLTKANQEALQKQQRHDRLNRLGNTFKDQREATVMGVNPTNPEPCLDLGLLKVVKKVGDK